MRFRVAALILTAVAFAGRVAAADSRREVVVVHNGDLALRAILFRPAGHGPFPAVLFSHGGGRGQKDPTYERDAAFYKQEPDHLGPVFARHGYVFLYLYRRGNVLSKGQGTYSGDLLDDELAAHGIEAMNHLQVRLLETDQLSDALAGLAYVRSLPDVDAKRTAAVGHSFGGSLTFLLVERDRSLRAAIAFAPAALSWLRSPELQARLRATTGRITAPVLILHAVNDYSVIAGKELAAELDRARKPHRIKIFPPYGKTEYDGHNYFLDLDSAAWEADVFAFLEDAMR
jgi:carboxymethylenebutenolidase